MELLKINDMKNKDKSAFPPLPSYTDDERGLTKREYFAGMAMQGIMSNDVLFTNILKDMKIDCTNRDNCHAVFAVKQADELLKQLND